MLSPTLEVFGSDTLYSFSDPKKESLTKTSTSITSRWPLSKTPMLQYIRLVSSTEHLSSVLLISNEFGIISETVTSSSGLV